MRALFVTGTDTGVGKTLASVSLAAYFSRIKGLSVGVMKPFETGLPLDRTEFFPCDAKSLKDASGSRDSLASINPCTFQKPLAPEAAALEEGKGIDLDATERICRDIVKNHDITIVEGAGGILVPIKENFFFQDLMKKWSLPVVVVARLGLGTINHTLLTCRSLESEGIRTIGVILNDSEGSSDVATRTNPGMLRKYLPVPLLGIMPYLEGFGDGGADLDRLGRMAATNLDVEAIYDGATLRSL
ncbi:MAG TPA: dethiobiotin synthase [Syntrophorhabdaceae bacterium]|jgi:dethiobiotin synthetase